MFLGPLPDRRARLDERIVDVSQSPSLVSLQHGLVPTCTVRIYSKRTLMAYGPTDIVDDTCPELLGL
jgi:hypothetical protein